MKLKCRRRQRRRRVALSTASSAAAAAAAAAVALTCLLSSQLHVVASFQPGLPFSSHRRRTLAASTAATVTTTTTTTTTSTSLLSPNLLLAEDTVTVPLCSMSATTSSLNPTMFLPPRGIATLKSSSTTTLGPPFRENDRDVTEQQHPRSRGVLGFAVDDLDMISTTMCSSSSSSTTTSSRQQRSGGGGGGGGSDSALQARPTNVDSAAWNVQDEQWAFSDTASSSNSKSSSDDANNNKIQWISSSTSSILSKSQYNPSSFFAESTTATMANINMSMLLQPQQQQHHQALMLPWIPSPTQIHSLTVAQLQHVCAERGLPVSGRKAVLQERILSWAQQVMAKQQQTAVVTSSLNLFQAYGTNNSNNSNNKLLKDSDATARKRNSDQKKKKNASPNSLAEWARTVDLEPLLHRRQEIRQEQLQGKKVVPKNNKKTQSDSKTDRNSSTNAHQRCNNKDDTLDVLQKVFDKPSSPYSNRQVKLMYAAAKQADQMGDRDLTRRILLQLKECTPHDARIYRRLARLEKEEGNLAAARAVLQEGLRLHPDNAYLWHGLGQMTATANQQEEAAECYRKAIQLDPSLPHSYHALGTAEHTAGRIANAMNILKQGVEYCPKNHRLHHALGDLYRDAKMLDMAERSYRKALQHSPAVSHGFAVTALAYTAYEQGNYQTCRSWLRHAVSLNEGRHANAWVGLAQFEESQGNIDAARSACVSALAQYERRLLKKFHRRPNNKQNDGVLSERALLEDPVAAKKAFLTQVPSYRSGDRFFNVYRNWARLEERYGSKESVDEVYERASLAFPKEWKITMDWAEYYEALNMHGHARALFAESCARASNRHADPYRLYAQFEMNLGNHTGARQILYAGAMSLSRAPDGGFGNQVGLAELFHTWAVCEWHLGEILRAENLFDHALRMTSPGESGSSLRAYILYSIAMLEHARGEHVLAQHCIGLSLKENSLPGGNARVWNLWTSVAEELGNKDLANECREQAALALSYEKEGNTSKLARMLNHRGASAPGIVQMVRRDPWQQEIFGTGEKPSKFFYAVRFPFHVAGCVMEEQEAVSAK